MATGVRESRSSLLPPLCRRRETGTLHRLRPRCVMAQGHGDSGRPVLHAWRPGFGVKPVARSSAGGGAARLGETASPWLSARSVSLLQERASVDTRRSRATTQPLLDSEEEFARQVRAYLAHEEVMRVRRAELSLARWEERAQREMSAGPGAQREPGPRLSAQRELHARYLAHVGEKGFVFLDSFDPWEYDPFALSPRGRALKQRFTSACPRLGHARRGATCST
uniref:Protein FAM228B isoform X1 n=2 Tax=Petromyzon marinus TaxID=7757 RepID=A0AAJ7U464_PETMA|nr:protein FAM228B isoform X1 [Petromyzon marinus]